jgi:hypothetical protein
MESFNQNVIKHKLMRQTHLSEANNIHSEKQVVMKQRCLELHAKRKSGEQIFLAGNALHTKGIPDICSLHIITGVTFQYGVGAGMRQS